MIHAWCPGGVGSDDRPGSGRCVGRVAEPVDVTAVLSPRAEERRHWAQEGTDSPELAHAGQQLIPHVVHAGASDGDPTSAPQPQTLDRCDHLPGTKDTQTQGQLDGAGKTATYARLIMHDPSHIDSIFPDC